MRRRTMTLVLVLAGLWLLSRGRSSSAPADPFAAARGVALPPSTPALLGTFAPIEQKLEASAAELAALGGDTFETNAQGSTTVYNAAGAPVAFFSAFPGAM